MAFETVVVGDAYVFLADVGTAFPALATDRSAFPADWGLVGEQHYPEGGGLEVNFAETMNPIRIVTHTLPVHLVRAAEDFSIGLTLRNADLAVLQLGSAHDLATTAAESNLRMDRGTVVEYRAALIRFTSPYIATGEGQYEIQRAYVGINGAFAHNRVTPTDIPLGIRVMAVETGIPILNRAARA